MARHFRLRTAVVLAALFPCWGQAGECDFEYGSYAPCTVEASIGPGETTLAQLSFELFNPDPQTLNWAIAPALESDPDCSDPYPKGGTWSSYTVFGGQVPPMTPSYLVQVTITVEAGSLPLGSYREYSCFYYPQDDTQNYVAIPIDLTVSDTAFADGFESEAVAK